MSWKNYPREFRCSECDGNGEVYCSCCDNTDECKKCRGEGLVGVDRRRMNEVISTERSKDAFGTWELEENGVWIGRTDGVSKWYYRDYAAPSDPTGETK